MSLAPPHLLTMPAAKALQAVAQWFDDVDTALALKRPPPPMPFAPEHAWIVCRIAMRARLALDAAAVPATLEETTMHQPQPCTINAVILRPASEEDLPGKVLVELPNGDRLFFDAADAAPDIAPPQLLVAEMLLGNIAVLAGNLDAAQTMARTALALIDEGAEACADALEISRQRAARSDASVSVLASQEWFDRPTDGRAA